MNSLVPSFIAGVASALLHVLSSYLGLGFIFLFLPTLPILWLGLLSRHDQSFKACLIGMLLVSILSNPLNAVTVYMLLLALPAWFIGWEALKRGGAHGLVVWFPLTAIFAQLMTAFSFMLLSACLYYSSVPGGIQAVVAPRIAEALDVFLKASGKQSTPDFEIMAANMAFMVFSISAWMWGACLYLHAWAVNRELLRQKIAHRPEMSLDALPPPNWMISLLLISACASLVGSPSLAFWGKASLIILLFPYFLLGLALIHRRANQLEYRNFFLVLLYITLALVTWLVVFVAGYGVVYHIRLLNKYLSSGGNSTKR